MTDKSDITMDASAASYRLREVLDNMRAIWRSSLEEASPDGAMDLYFVDADVVTMFMAPYKNHNYGALLRYDSYARRDAGSELKSLEARLVEFLGNLIFFQLRPTMPLLLLPGHAEDLERILGNVWKNALSELGEWEQIRSAIEKTQRDVEETSRTKLANADLATSAQTGRAQTVEGLLGDIFRSLRGEGAIGELFRFESLASCDRLRHLDQMPLNDEKGQVRYLPPPLSGAGKYVPSVSRLAHRLNQVMLRRIVTKPPDKTFWVRRDATALAHLAWLNQLFSEEPWFIKAHDGSIRRIRQAVLITGSHLLPQAIDELELEPLRTCVTSPLSFLGHQLMDEYFRSSAAHQIAYIDKASQGAQVSALINFFDSMRAVLNTAIKSHNTSNISIAISNVRGKHSELTEAWRNRQLFGSHSRMEAVSDAIEFLLKSGRNLDGLKNFLEELSVDAWQSFARVVTMLSLKSATIDDKVQRNIPPVRFSRFVVAASISAELYSTGDNARAREHAETILDKSTVKKLQKEDPSHYTEFVCYALFGLVHRVLRIAEGCTEVAWAIAQEKPTIGDLAEDIVGDEALYLLAHIIRLRAHRREQLDRAERCIELAMEASRQAPAINLDDYVDDIRFRVERFSIHCHQIYFEFFGSVGARNPIVRIDKNPNKLKLTYQEGNQLLAEINKTTPRPAELYLFEYVKQQLLVNLAQIGMLWLYPAQRTADEKIEVYCSLERDSSFERFFEPVAQQLIKQCCDLDNDKTCKLPKSSILAASVAAVANAVFLDKCDLSAWFRPAEGKVAAIDALRFKYLESVYNYYQKIQRA